MGSEMCIRDRSETMVRVAEIEIDGKNFLIPRANLEMVELQ